MLRAGGSASVGGTRPRPRTAAAKARPPRPLAGLPRGRTRPVPAPRSVRVAVGRTRAGGGSQPGPAGGVSRDPPCRCWLQACRVTFAGALRLALHLGAAVRPGLGAPKKPFKIPRKSKPTCHPSGQPQQAPRERLVVFWGDFHTSYNLSARGSEVAREWRKETGAGPRHLVTTINLVPETVRSS